MIYSSGHEINGVSSSSKLTNPKESSFLKKPVKKKKEGETSTRVKLPSPNCLDWTLRELGDSMKHINPCMIFEIL